MEKKDEREERKERQKIMKKSIKAIGMFALAATLSMGMTSVANATTGEYTITINEQEGSANSIDGNTYTVYKIADFDVSGGKYTNIKPADGFKDLENIEENLKALDGKATDSDEAKAFANKVAAHVTAATPSKGSTTIDGTTGAVSVTETGYYLIVDTAHGAKNPYLTTRYILKAVDGLDADLNETDNNENVYVKTSKAGVTKKIVSEHNGTLEDANTVAIGDTVTYQLNADIPMYKEDASGINYELTDTMSAGLTFTGITSVEVGNVGTTGEISWSEAIYDTTLAIKNQNKPGATVNIKLTNDEQLIKNRKVKVILTAKLNDKANVGASGNPNSVDLKYSNSYTGGGDSYTTPEDTVITYTGELKLIKKDQDAQDKPLKGAVFDIYRVVKGNESVDKKVEIDEQEVKLHKITTTSSSDEYGKITVRGLDVGTYYAIETTAPEGYSIKEDPIELRLTVSQAMGLNENGDAGDAEKVTDYTNTTAGDANSTVIDNYPAEWKTNENMEATILNAKGLSLPGTGGMGTTLFTFGGLVLVLVAGIMFVVYIRRQKKQS